MNRFTHHYDLDCPDCRGGRVVKAGQRNGHQRYKCKDCGKKFRKVIRIETPAESRKFDDELIGATIFEYFMGMSIRNSARNIKNRYGIPQPSTDTIFQWVKDYTEAATFTLRDAKAHSCG